jgi:proteic killer suppression protein
LRTAQNTVRKTLTTKKANDSSLFNNPRLLPYKYVIRITYFCYNLSMIQGFKCRDTQKLYEGQRVRRFDGIRAQAERRLDRLDQATTLADLAGLPSNRLERLRGDRKGQHSIRINDQWRICFIWEDDGPHAVEIVDYH